MGRWKLEYADGEDWVEKTDAAVDEVVEELSGHEEVSFSIPNTAANRAFVSEIQIIRISFDETQVYLGALFDYTMIFTKLKCIVYNGIYEQLKRRVITQNCYWWPANAIAEWIRQAAGLINPVEGCPTTHLDMFFDQTICFDAIEQLAEVVQKDYWVTGGDTLHIGDRGSAQSFDGTIATASERTIGRSKKRDKVHFRGCTPDGEQVMGVAGEGDDVAVFWCDFPTTEANLDILAAQKLAEINQDDSNVVLTCPITSGVHLHPGDTITVNKPQFDLDGSYRIMKITKHRKTVDIEITRKKRTTEDVLAELSKKISQMASLGPTFRQNDIAFMVHQKDGVITAKANRDGLVGTSGTSAATVLRFCAEQLSDANPGFIKVLASDAEYLIADGEDMGDGKTAAVIFDSRCGLVGEGDGTCFKLTADLDYVFGTKMGQMNWRNYFGQFSVDGDKDSRSKGTAIRMHNVQHGTVEHCGILRMKEHGVYLDAESPQSMWCLGNYVRYNNIEDCAGAGVKSENYSFDHIITDNIIGGELEIVDEETGETATGDGIVLSFTTQAIVTNNHIWQTKIGIQLFMTHSAKVTDNIIFHTASVGVLIQNCHNNQILDNRCEDCCQFNGVDPEHFGADGIRVEGTLVEGPPEEWTQYYSEDVTVSCNRVFSEYGQLGIVVGDYAHRVFVDGNNCYGNPDPLWDIYDTGVETDGIMFGINYGRCPSNDYKNLGYPNTHLLTGFLIGSGGVLANQLVSISGDNIVVKATLANSAKGIGVTVAAGDEDVTAKILVIGRIPVKAGAAVSAGDMITASDTYPGRGIPVPSTFYQVTTSEAPAHGHSCSEQGSHVHVIDAVGDHNHGGSTGAGGSHYHTTDSGGSHSHGGSTGASSGPHTHSVGATWSTSGGGGDPSHTHGYYAPSSPTGSGSGSHQHGISSDGSHYHTTGDSIPSTHAHTITADGNHAHTMQYNDDHLHTIGLDGVHTHTVAIPLGKVFGKAATSATLGNDFDLILGCVS